MFNSASHVYNLMVFTKYFFCTQNDCWM